VLPGAAWVASGVVPVVADGIGQPEPAALDGRSSIQ